MNQRPILITGATGKSGSRIASLLDARGANVRRGGRELETRFDWCRPETFASALQDCGAAYLCYYPDYAFPGAEEALTTFTKTAREAGVNHIVMLVGRGESHAIRAESTVRRGGIPTTVLRSAWFAQNFSEGAFLQGVRDSVVAMAGGDVREPVIDLDDLCEVAARMLLAAPSNRTLELTGPQSITFTQMTIALSQILKKPVKHLPISFEEFYEELRSVTDSSYARVVTDIAKETLDGRNERTSTDVERLLGRPATDFKTYARRAAAAGAWD